jgi:uncharacterized protein (TIGR00730 family)
MASVNSAMKPTNICVFCGSALGLTPEYQKAARAVGRALVRHGIGLVYGGGRVGLMGIVADSVLERGGRAIGVIPEALATKEIAHDGLTELHVVTGMHERKALMARRSSAFLTLPGGIGTFEEFFEALSWASLGLHRKPLGILNVTSYYDPLLALFDHAIAQRFIRPELLKLLFVSSDPDSVVSHLAAHSAPAGEPQRVDFD